MADLADRSQRSSVTFTFRLCAAPFPCDRHLSPLPGDLHYLPYLPPCAPPRTSNITQAERHSHGGSWKHGGGGGGLSDDDDDNDDDHDEAEDGEGGAGDGGNGGPKPRTNGGQSRRRQQVLY